MRWLAVGVAIASLAVGAVLGPLPDGGCAPNREHGPHPAVTSELPLQGGPATLRAGSSPSPKGTHALSRLRGLSLPCPTAVAAAADAVESAAPLFLKLAYPQRGPPTPLA